MTIDENTRLDLRRAFEELIGPELANAAMEAMPPLDYNQLATRTDVNNLGITLRSELAEVRTELKTDIAGLKSETAGVRTGLKSDIADVRAEMTELRADLKNDIADARVDVADLRVDLTSDIARLDHRMATNLRTTVLTQFATMAAFAGFVVGLG